MIKIAIPTNKGLVDDHFGHCKHYSIYSVDDKNKIRLKENLPSPLGCGCKSNIASELKELGVTVLLAGNMGNGALTMLQNHHIKVLRGCSGSVDDVVHDYINNKITDSGYACVQLDADHACSHD